MTNNLNKVSTAFISHEPVPLEVRYYISSMLARQKAFHNPIEAFEKPFIVNAKMNGFSTKGKRKRKIEVEVEVKREEGEAEAEGSCIAQINIQIFRQNKWCVYIKIRSLRQSAFPNCDKPLLFFNQEFFSQEQRSLPCASLQTARCLNLKSMCKLEIFSFL
jgi:hypothetical protein